jgi:hypothetical protein
LKRLLQLSRVHMTKKTESSFLQTLQLMLQATLTLFKGKISNDSISSYVQFNYYRDFLMDNLFPGAITYVTMLCNVSRSVPSFVCINIQGKVKK